MLVLEVQTTRTGEGIVRQIITSRNVEYHELSKV